MKGRVDQYIGLCGFKSYDGPEAFFEKHILTSEEACLFLGISYRTLLRLVKADAVPVSRINRLLRFSRKKLERWVEEKGI
jgi:excisionase family DNA binding protein